MVWAKWVGGVWTCALLGVLTAFVGCNGSSSSNACVSYCDNLCTSLEACDLELTDCRSSCEGGLTSKACKGQKAPDRLTCAELTETVACSDYCVTLCERAPSCGSFDSGACVVGCLEQGPPICNAASVAARSCDQLKPELRLYEDIGSAGEGEGVGGFVSPGSAGLCEDAGDCDEPLGCSTTTSTCSPCQSTDDCAGRYGAYVCNDDAECEKVECLSNDDCLLTGACDTEAHTCVDCLADADCSTGACDTKTMKCVQCKKDSDCKSSFSPSCDVEQNKCVECGEDAHCSTDIWPACDLEARECVECNVDAHCTRDSFSPGCDATKHECVECTKDAHCPEDYPRCDAESHTCRECRTSADCGADAPRCNEATLFCTACDTNADCEGQDKPVCTPSGACGDCENDQGCPQGEECEPYDGTCAPADPP